METPDSLTSVVNIYSSIHLFICPSIHPFLHPFILLSLSPYLPPYPFPPPFLMLFPSCPLECLLHTGVCKALFWVSDRHHTQYVMCQLNQAMLCPYISKGKRFIWSEERPELYKY